ncbi:MAG: RNA 2',3'-cyclic phosphodiesterase [Anaerolineae bacterium]|nr:RNA 2',3'-cyclic phosphodiesterase [Anaerolineae bacterium]
MMNESRRLFIAIELPPDILKTIARVQADLKQAIPDRAVRWTRPEGIHLTLKFLGDVHPSRLDAIKAALRQAVTGHAPFELSIHGSGCFPDFARPRVLWVGLAGEMESLHALQTDVESSIAPLGFPTEERGFNPHLTLARTSQQASREDIAQIGKIVQAYSVRQLVAWQVKSIYLMHSRLKPDGAQYTQVAEVALSEQPLTG